MNLKGYWERISVKTVKKKGNISNGEGAKAMREMKFHLSFVKSELSKIIEITSEKTLIRTKLQRLEQLL